ncbi:MAG: FAD-binding protein, partial [Spirochaetales bacterium]|nr:FAD-binding protein [Spirochaetales bacterium]
KGINAGVSNGANAGGPIAVGTKIQDAEGENLTLETLFTHMSEYGNSTINDSLLKKVLSVTGETIDYFAELGMNIYLRTDNYGVGFRARHGIRDRGVDRATFLTDKIEANGGKIFYETAGESLIQDAEGRVTGINAVKSNGDKIVITAKAVLLATGGYLGSEEKIHDKFGNINIIPLGNTLSTGDGVDMALAAGGREDRNWGIVANEFSAANKNAGAWSFACNENLRFGIYGGLLVNMEGNRFFNEEVMANEPLAGAETTLRQKKYYAVMDSAYYDSVGSIGIFETLGSPMAWKAGYLNLSESAPASRAHAKILSNAADQLAEAVDQGWAYKADSIAELAEYFSLDNLEATVAEYNDMCADGEDTLFYKSDYFMTPVTEGPFYVFEYEPSAWCTLGGIVVDDSLRVTDKDFQPIPGLYAAGLDAGSLYTSPYYDNEGSAFGLALGSGTLAGRIMAEAVR